MSTDDRIRNRSKFKKPLFIVGICMTIFYLGLGSTILLVKDFLPGIPPDYREMFAAMLVIYGLYRGWRVYADYYPTKEQ